MATNAGTLTLDPRQLRTDTPPPHAAITGLTANGTPIRDPSNVKLAAGSGNLRIDFAVPGLAVPNRATVKYRLVGFDPDWIDPGLRREAFYTNLPPGSYRFEVLAANENGLWASAPTTLSIDLPPTFWQSRWFVALCVLAVLLFGWLLHRMRSAQLMHRVTRTLRERMAERERIARELHDTLLQGVHELMLRFRVANDGLAKDDPARPRVDAALDRAEQVIAEARDRVRDLRRESNVDDLARLIVDQATGLGIDQKLTVHKEGPERPLHPVVVTEISRVASEAFANIARHADASAVSVTIDYTARGLSVEIADDGVGFDRDISAQQPAGHFGVIGMEERVRRLGGQFSLKSARGAGTSVTMHIPARSAYPDRPGSRLFRWWNPAAAFG